MHVTRYALFFAIAAIALRLAAGAQDQTPEVLDADHRLIEYAKQNSELMNNLEYLSDMIGPRLTGSENLRKANDWTAAKFKEYGLENVHLEKWTIPVGWERGVCEVQMVTPHTFNISAACYAWDPNTRGRITGPVVLIPASMGDDELQQKFAGKLKNAIILSSAPANVQEHPSLDSPAARGRRGLMGTDETSEAHAAQQMLSKRMEFLKKEGAAIQLIDAGKPQMLLNMTGGWPGKNGPNPLTRLFMAHEHYGMLYRLVQHGEPVALQVNVQNRFHKGPIDVYNTVGEIRGSEKPDEVVLCGAHLDSWDLGQGSTDNGTGSMVVLEAARIIKASGVKPKRTIRFVLFTGEEQGLYGSRAYVDAHKGEMGKISAVFVHDTGTGKVTGIGLHGNAQVQPVFEKELPILKELGVTNFSTFLMGGTDHASFYSSNVPGFWFMQESADYGWMHHSQSDTFDKALKDELSQGATVMAVCAYDVAQLPEMLPRREAAR